MERGSEGENGLQMLSRSEGEGGNEAAEGEETDLLTVNERPSFLSFLSFRAHQRHALLALWREKWFQLNSASIYLLLARTRTLVCTRSHWYGTWMLMHILYTGWICFDFWLLWFLRRLDQVTAQTTCQASVCVCVSVWGSVCRSVMMDPQPVVGIAQFQLLLLALCSTGLIFPPPVSCLTPAFHYYLAPAQEGLRYCS